MAVCTFAAQPSELKHVSAAQVDAALKSGANAVLRTLRDYRTESNAGATILRVMAALNAGVPADDPMIAEAVRYLSREAVLAVNDYAGVYQCGLMNMLLLMLKDPQNSRRMAERMTHELARMQNTNGSWGDYSRTQFALLGLKAAQDLGVTVPPQVFLRARKFVEAGQNDDGSWGYTPRTQGYGSMTAAGITSLFIIYEQEYKDNPVCGAPHKTERLQAGLNWLGKNFTVRTNPQKGNFHYYYLYAMERIGVLTGQKFIGGQDWYRAGAEYLVPKQLADGLWNEDMLATEFALLFLGKGREPVAVQKLSYGPDWNTDPYDARYLVEQASEDLQIRMSTQVVDSSASASALAAAPILYLQGRKQFEFTPGLREAIKGFIEQGGFVVASACCGGKEFDHSFRLEMKTMFPDAAFERVPDDHDIFTKPHRIVSQNAFMIEGLNTGCRTSVFFAPHDICCAWGKCKGCLDKSALVGQDSANLGVNVIAYALNFQNLRNKLDEINLAVNKADTVSPRGALFIGQLYHAGEWDPDPGAIPNLATTLKEQTGMKAEVAKRKVALGSDDLADYPLLYITGHQGFQYTPSQVDALRTYLDKGGFLLAEPCCGKLEFDISFRRLCEQLYPDQPLKPLPPDHPLLRGPPSVPFVIDTVEYKPAVKKLFPAIGNKLQVEGISAPNGRLQILYSRFNFGCELQGHGCPACLGLTKKDAYRLAVNAVLYALSH